MCAETGRIGGVIEAFLQEDDMVSQKKTESGAIRVTPELLTKYDKPGPRYTSYPTAPEWRDDFGDGEYRKALADAATRPDEELSFYVHVPFCGERCKFCSI